VLGQEATLNRLLGQRAKAPDSLTPAR
jgi:hypothetical protein